jgi:hypothetical protein
MTGIAGCCAAAASGQAAEPPARAMKSRRLIFGFRQQVAGLQDIELAMVSQRVGQTFLQSVSGRPRLSE